MSRARIQLSLTIADDRITADFAGTSPQVRRPVNSPMNYTRAYVAVPLKMICDPELPNNEGTYRPLEISAPAGTLINPTYPAACFWRLASGHAGLRAGLPHPGGYRTGAGTRRLRLDADLAVLRERRWRNGEGWALHQHAFGGMGGRPGADGLGAVSFPYNVRNVSVEWSETETPVLFLRRELIANSGGAGRWRGGLGEELVMTVEKTAAVPPSAPLTLSGSAGRTRYPARGRCRRLDRESRLD